jgi:hypothetical protein
VAAGIGLRSKALPCEPPESHPGLPALLPLYLLPWCPIEDYVMTVVIIARLNRRIKRDAGKACTKINVPYNQAKPYLSNFLKMALEKVQKKTKI